MLKWNVDVLFCEGKNLVGIGGVKFRCFFFMFIGEFEINEIKVYVIVKFIEVILWME